MPPFIRLDRVSKAFGATRAINDLSLDIRQGELFCLLGASGCGKTTLLRILAGFEAPDSGVVEIDGINMDGVDPADRPVNIMFQNYALFPHYSAADNVGYGLTRDGIKGGEWADRVAELLKLVRLEGFGGRKIHQLSGGQRQRVALARALARRPKLLLLDEPLAALDKKLREETQFELVNIQDRLGTTFMVVTHDQEEAMVLADRMGVMDKGELVQVDTPRGLYERPKTRFVADFLGSVTLIEGVVLGCRSGVVRLETQGGAITAAHNETLPKGSSVTVAIRPEKISLSKLRLSESKRSAQKTPNCFQVTIDDLAFTGVATYYRARTEDGLIFKIHAQNRLEDNALTWDETAYIHFAPADAIILTE